MTSFLYLMCYIIFGDIMKKKILLIICSIFIGVLFTFFFLNKENIYAKEEYLVYAFQVGTFNNIENANNYKSNLPSGIIVKDNNFYKVYVGIYNDIDLVNKMLVYFEDNGINIYLNNIKINKELYNKIENLEKILINSNDINVYNKVNQSILDMYINGDNL